MLISRVEVYKIYGIKNRPQQRVYTSNTADNTGKKVLGFKNGIIFLKKKSIVVELSVLCKIYWGVDNFENLL